MKPYDIDNANIAIDSGSENNLLHLISGNYKNRSIAGIDIYKYSSLSENNQAIVPLLFKKLYNITLEKMVKSEPWLFGMEAEKYAEKFISTGDGGFLLRRKSWPSISLFPLAA